MTTSSPEAVPTDAVPFRDARWKPRWIIVGLAVLALFRYSALIDREWFASFPFIVVVAITFAAQFFFDLSDCHAQTALARFVQISF